MTGQTFKARYASIFACIIIIVAMCVRVGLNISGWPQTNSDESTVGIMALHIAYHGEHPLIYYGQNYMGALEAYIAALLFHMLGAPSLLAVRLGVDLLFIPFFIIMYIFISMIYTRQLALIALLLIGLAPQDVLYQQLMATAGHPEMPLFASVIMLLAAWLALTINKPTTSNINLRLLAYSVWGGVVGLALWDDFLVIPFVVVSFLLLVIACRKEFDAQIVFCAIGSFLLGILPLVLYIAQMPEANNPTTIFGLTAGWQNRGSATLWQSIVGVLVVTLPMMTGANSLCPLPSTNRSPFDHLSDPAIFRCTIVHIGWSLGFIVLLLLALWQALYCYWQTSRATSYGKDEKTFLANLHLTRFLLLAAPASMLLVYTLTPQPALAPWSSSRYLIGFVVALPAVLWPLWSSLDRFRSQTTLLAQGTMFIKYLLIALIMTTPFLGVIATLRSVPDVQAINTQQATMIQDLEHLGIKHFYTDYWTCNIVILQTQERLICGVVGDELREGMNRYPPFFTVVQQDASSAYVMPQNTPAATAVMNKAAHAAKSGRLLTMDGFVVYIPAH